MKFAIIFLTSQSILLPIIAGLMRFTRLGRTYQPLFMLLIVGFITEIISYFVIRAYPSVGNAIPVNIYTLIEALAIITQFHIWGLLKHKKKTFLALLASTLLIWIVINVSFKQIYEWSPYFRFYYYFLIVLLSVNEINFMITHYNRNLFRHPKFLICIGFIIYFVYMIVYYWAFEVSKEGTSEISITIMTLVAYVNVLANVIYAIAFLVIPAPQKFMLK